jgi:BMFP domain-containing protein YqiC
LSSEITQVRNDLSAEIGQVRSELSADITQVRTDLSAEIQSFREEVMEKFAQTKDRFEIMAEEWLEARGEQKRLRKRIEELERKAS